VGAPSAPFGFINAFKPPGLSSTSFGLWVRKRLGASALGHWGTLDPAAFGVLVLAVGRATRLIPYLPSEDKSYVFEMRAGACTDTGDATGRIVRQSAVPEGWAASLSAVAASMVGPLEQTPPMYSAVKIDGRPLYISARAGREVERRPRRVEIRALRVIDAGIASARLAVDCSSGTYVRTLCEQIGDRIGICAHLGLLLRTRAGPFDLDAARTPREIEADPAACIIDPAAVLRLEKADVDDAGAAKFLHGNDVAIDAAARRLDPRTVLVHHRGALIGVGLLGQTLVPVRVLAAGGENP
jgi:tRNA pseudouridine55 synthase